MLKKLFDHELKLRTYEIRKHIWIDWKSLELGQIDAEGYQDISVWFEIGNAEIKGEFQKCGRNIEWFDFIYEGESIRLTEPYINALEQALEDIR